MAIRRSVTVLLALAALGSAAPHRATAQGPLRPTHSISLDLGGYGASGFSTNVYYGAKYNYHFGAGRYFVEAGVGFSSINSRVLETVSRTTLYEDEKLFVYDFAFSYDFDPSGPVPYLTFGVAGVNQGGQSIFGGVVGLGKRITFGSSPVGIRYDVRDHIYSQTLNNSDPFLTHNIVFTVGAQFYF